MNVRDLIEALAEYPDYWDVATSRCVDVRELTVEPRPSRGSVTGEDGNVVVIR